MLSYDIVYTYHIHAYYVLLYDEYDNILFLHPVLYHYPFFVLEQPQRSLYLLDWKYMVLWGKFPFSVPFIVTISRVFYIVWRKITIIVVECVFVFLCIVILCIVISVCFAVRLFVACPWWFELDEHVEPCSSTSFAAFCEWGEWVLILKMVSLSCHDILGDNIS